MISRALIRQVPNSNGFLYLATEAAGAFLDNFRSTYIEGLRHRANWVTGNFDAFSDSHLEAVITQLFRAWTIEFQPVQVSSQTDLSL